MRRSFVILFLLVVCREAPGQWDAKPHATDAPKRHVEKVAAGKHAYTVKQGGTMDGVNCRSPIGVGMLDGPAIEQTWESNRAVRLENVGQTDVLTPWPSNGRNDLRLIAAIVAAAIRSWRTDREKALALWYQEIRHEMRTLDAQALSWGMEKVL